MMIKTLSQTSMFGWQALDMLSIHDDVRAVSQRWPQIDPDAAWTLRKLHLQECHRSYGDRRFCSQAEARTSVRGLISPWPPA